MAPHPAIGRITHPHHQMMRPPLHHHHQQRTVHLVMADMVSTQAPTQVPNMDLIQATAVEAIVVGVDGAVVLATVAALVLGVA